MKKVGGNYRGAGSRMHQEVRREEAGACFGARRIEGEEDDGVTDGSW